MKKTSLILAAAFSIALPYSVYAQVPLDCSGSNCGTAQVPANNEANGVQLPGGQGMPPASDAGTASGQPVSGGTAPSTPATDPVAPTQPPSP